VRVCVCVCVCETARANVRKIQANGESPWKTMEPRDCFARRSIAEIFSTKLTNANCISYSGFSEGRHVCTEAQMNKRFYQRIGACSFQERPVDRGRYLTLSVPRDFPPRKVSSKAANCILASGDDAEAFRRVIRAKWRLILPSSRNSNGRPKGRYRLHRDHVGRATNGNARRFILSTLLARACRCC